MTVIVPLHSAIIYHCDLTKEPLQPHVFREVTVKGFNPSDYQTTQVTRNVAARMCKTRLTHQSIFRMYENKWKPVSEGREGGIHPDVDTTQ